MEFPSESPELVPALVVALKDKDFGVRVAVCEALGNHGPAARAAVPGLIRLLKDENAPKQAAADALRKIDPDAAAKAGVRIRE